MKVKISVSKLDIAVVPRKDLIPKQHAKPVNVGDACGVIYHYKT